MPALAIAIDFPFKLGLNEGSAAFNFN